MILQELLSLLILKYQINLSNKIMSFYIFKYLKCEPEIFIKYFDKFKGKTVVWVIQKYLKF